MAERDLKLCNVGGVPTCVRLQGSSVVDLTWALPSLLGRIIGWHVVAGFESLSDHRYVSFQVAYALSGRSDYQIGPLSPLVP